MERRPNGILSDIRERIRTYEVSRKPEDMQIIASDFCSLFNEISSYLMSSESYVGYIMCALDPQWDETLDCAIHIQLELDISYLKYNPFLLAEMSLSTIMFVIASEIENILHAVPALEDGKDENKTGAHLMAIQRYLEFQLSPTMNFDDPQMKDIDEKSFDSVLEMSDMSFEDQMELSKDKADRREEVGGFIADMNNPRILSVDGTISEMRMSDLCSFEYISEGDIDKADLILNSFFFRIGKILSQGSEKMRGTLPGNVYERIEARIKEKPLDWKKLLRCAIANVPSGKRKTRLRLNRRQPNRSDISGEISDRVPSVTIAIDTSGSISNQDFSRIVNQVYAICDQRKIGFTLVECDMRICRVTDVRKKKDIPTGMAGRGGTAFTPVIDYINNEGKKRNQILIYFTDGYGESSIPKPKVHKMIWVLVGRGAKMSVKEPYGIVIEDLNK